MTTFFLQFSSPEVGAKRKNEVKLLRADFGDGYSSVTPDGLNYQREVWDLTFPYLTRSDANNLWAFFQDACGSGVESFYYTVPGMTTQKRYTCEVYDWTEKEAGYVTITATIKQTFNLDN